MSSTYTDLTGAAKILRVSYGVAYRLALRGEFEAERVGGRWRVLRESVERLARERDAAEGARG